MSTLQKLQYGVNHKFYHKIQTKKNKNYKCQIYLRQP